MTDETLKMLLEKAQSPLDSERTAAFEGLREQYAPLLGATVRSFAASLPSYGEDDLRQEADLVLYRVAGRYRVGETCSFGSYLRICLRNRFVSLLRRERRLPKISRADPDRMAAGARGGGTDRKPYQKRTEEETAFVRAVRLYGVGKEGVLRRTAAEQTLYGKDSPLTKTEKEAYTAYLEGKSYDAIAAKLRCERKSVDNAIHRAKAKIARFL